MLAAACSDNPATSSGQIHAGISNKQPPSTTPVVTVKINFEMGQAQGQGLDIYKGEFRPQELSIKPGTIVAWVNNDDYWVANHIVTSRDGLFEKELKFGESFNFTFSQKGTFEYYCKAYPIMTGKVIVE